MNHIIVIGCPGSGKTYFSKQLSSKLKVPVVHMDRIYWREDKSHITREELKGNIAQIMRAPNWIIDGNYISTMEQRIREADVIFFLDFPTEVCLEGIRERRGVKRDDLPWIETEDQEFEKFIIDFKDKTLPIIEGLLSEYSNKQIIRFYSRKEMQDYLESK